MRSVLWLFVSIWLGRETGCVIDKQYRDSGGNPVFLNISDKWLWLFQHKSENYSVKNKILRVSVFVHIIGYVFALQEFILLVCVILGGDSVRISDISTNLFCLCILCMMIITIPFGIRYEVNMKKTYQYDWITDIQNLFSICPKRRCQIVSQIDENLYEISIGKWYKHIYRAESKASVNIGDRKYAVHYFHNMDEDVPYWHIVNH